MEIVIAAVKSVVNKGVWRVVEAKGIVKGHFFLSLFFRGVLESGIFFAVDLPCQEGVSIGSYTPSRVIHRTKTSMLWNEEPNNEPHLFPFFFFSDFVFLFWGFSFITTH